MPEAIPITPLKQTVARDWEALRRSFRGKAAIEFGQPWLKKTEPLFAAAQVRVALSGMSLSVFATFRDHDVFNPVGHFNVPAFPHGDVFEVFLRPQGQAAYYEFHITPGGALLQLRWPEPMRNVPLDWPGVADPLLPYKITRWRLRVQTREIKKGWEAHVQIPLKRIFEDDPPWDGSLLRAGFARYDYTRGRLRPVLSATAPLREPDFHRTAEWHMLELRFR
jgi:hypothetical protein